MVTAAAASLRPLASRAARTSPSSRRTSSRTPFSFSAMPRIRRRRRQGSATNCSTRNSTTLTPIRPHVPQVLCRRIRSLQICSSWYRFRIPALSAPLSRDSSASASVSSAAAAATRDSSSWSDRYSVVKRSRSAGFHVSLRASSVVTSRCVVARWLVRAL
ncbi:hypothetical protein VTK26DRAFT_8535 [Humicola hyalothermophila]